ncbi:SID1 transmembrane family member 1 isoform X1 [Pelobates cultripes]|uniref:SID1 transmembrane family member 1 isoform X1 n=2 Tax=Pelobates cultripes TaxID=61616 RepID=A0AAD1VHY3_PELCU|nr:SID1 transmembrane family member 1 isoform X1 [Pelobates cultripes]
MVTRLINFELQTNQLFNFSASPSQPQYFLYTFPEGVESVIIKVKSTQVYPCSVVSVQDIVCPVYDSDHNVEFNGVYQSMTKKAAITIQRKDFPKGRFYVVFVIKPEDYACGGSVPQSTLGSSNGTWNLKREKDFEVFITPSINSSVYIQSTLLCLLFFFIFYLGSLLVALVHYIRLCTDLTNCCPHPDPTTKSVVFVRVPSRLSLTYTLVGILWICWSYPTPQPAAGTLGSICPGISRLLLLSLYEHHSHVTHLLELMRLDNLPNLGCGKRVAGFKPFFFAHVHTAREVEYCGPVLVLASQHCIKSPLFFLWNSSMTVFHNLPWLALNISSGSVLGVRGILSGNIGYTNYLIIGIAGLCAFNNVMSNMGHVLLGFLFLFIVLRRDLLHRNLVESKDIYAMEYGIPKHFGLFYTMGIALTMEGVLSACYHVCPNYSNFQFDTSFMYMIAGLCMLKLYQTRHPDINASAYAAYASFALVIFLAVLGVVFGKDHVWFWIIFSIIHVMGSLALSTHIYYMGRFKIDVSNADFGIFRRIFQVLYTDCIRQCNRPMYMDRMVLLVLGNVVNWSLAIFGLVCRPRDFASYLLGIFICNLLLYLAFYIIMKLRSSEKIQPLPLFCIFATAIVWAAALYFFFQTLSSWEETPAQSREKNRDCTLLNFFDDHDIWHFLSASAMFFSFLVLLTLDDDLDTVPRDKIPVF